MSTLAGAPVVAGVDGSTHEQLVIDWAISEARLRNRTLLLLHAYDWAVLGASFTDPPYGAVQQVYHDDAASIRDHALAAARTAAPDLEVSARVVDGGAAGVLVGASQSAAAVVVGHRGR
ncbi:MAG TPA: universal stress protein, partial [Micromonosporaceae bacterium]|nr:universal stress protein [Micromonosporaceae bacterium]